MFDRAKDMIISGGFNVYPREVEDCLSRHPAVAMAAVIGIPDPKRGRSCTGRRRLTAGYTTPAEELIALLREKKGAVQAPKVIAFRERLPLTAGGKLDKKALRAKYWRDNERQVG
jgi:fatty-acyl-CoA synthase